MNQALVFKGTGILVSTHEGRQYVSVRHVCEALGIPFQGQHEKLRNSPEFSYQDIMTPAADGKFYKMFCILADHVHLWVAGISAAKITNPERQKQFIAYKHECAKVLHEHFVAKGGDFLGIAQQLVEMQKEMREGFSNLACITETVFGDDKEEVNILIKQVAEKYRVDGRTVWGWIQTDCDVGSYKKQTSKIKRFLREKLGTLSVVKEDL